MVDRLDIAIEEKRKFIESLKHQIAEAEVDLRVLERAAESHPITFNGARVIEPKSTNGPAKRGRQKGAISHAWRQVFGEMVKSGHANTPEEIQKFASKQGINLTDRSAKTRARDYVKAGFLEARDEGYWVTDNTIDRFDLSVRK
jgi:hypothetical protein